MSAPLPVLLRRAWLLLLLLATSPRWAQQPAAPGTRSLPPTPGLGPAPGLSPQATPAEKAAYTRQLAERTRQRWNYLLTDSLMRTKVFNTAPNTLLVKKVQSLPPGTALDADMGKGRNALYLAQHGWQVTGVDIARRP
ncbi:MAG: hypothetical protein ACRYFX_08140 [Janthinobacterium lividum]